MSMWSEQYRRLVSASGMLWGGAVFAAAFAFGIGYFFKQWRVKQVTDGQAVDTKTD